MYIRKEEAKSVAYDRESALCYPTNIIPGFRSFDSGAIRGWRLMSYDSAYFCFRLWGPSVPHMDEGSEGDKTSREGGLPTLPGLYHSTIQPSQRGFFRVHMFV